MRVLNAEWQAAVLAANAEASAQLRRLAERLEPRLAALTAAANFSVLMQALLLHTSHATAAAWTLPALEPLCAHGDVGSSSSPAASGGTPGASPDKRACLEVEGMWPYWMDGRGGGTVANDVSLTGVALLTGPNMAGMKCGVGACGLGGMPGPAQCCPRKLHSTPSPPPRPPAQASPR